MSPERDFEGDASAETGEGASVMPRHVIPTRGAPGDDNTKDSEQPRKAAVRMPHARKASPVPLYVASIACAFWVATILAYAFGYYGPTGLMTLPPTTAAALAAALFAPLAIIWGFGFLLYWGGQMRSAAEAMSEATIAMLRPADTAIAGTATVANAVSDEMRRMETALTDAEARALELRKSLHGELNGLEAASARAEMRARTLRDLVGAERKALAEVGAALESESAHVVQVTRGQAELVSEVTGRAAEQLAAAQSGLARAGEHLSKTLETVARSAAAVRNNVESQTARLDKAADDAVSRTEAMSAQYAANADRWSAQTRAMSEENERAVRAFAEQRETMEKLATDLRERAREIETAIESHAGLIDAALDGAEAKAAGLGPRMAREAQRLTQAASEAVNAVGKSSKEFHTRTEELRTTVDQTTEHMSQSLDFTAKSVDASGERLKTTLAEVGQSAQQATGTLKKAAEELAARMAALPEDARGHAERLRSVMSEQIAAIASVAESVADSLERIAPGPLTGAWPPADVNPPAAIASGETAAGEPAQPVHADGGKRRLSDILSAARARENKAGAEASVPRAAHHIVETLQSLSIDIDRALTEEPPLDLWRRYRAGERRVFARRLASLRSKEPHSRILEKYRSDAEFRADVDRYIDQFEGLLAKATENDRDAILAETYMSSDIGKVYALLAEATGRLG